MVILVGGDGRVREGREEGGGSSRERDTHIYTRTDRDTHILLAKPDADGRGTFGARPAPTSL